MSRKIQIVMKRRLLKKIFKNNRKGNQRNSWNEKSSNSKSNSKCHKCESTDLFIKECLMWKTEKGKGKARKSRRQFTKGTPNKTNFRKAMIIVWGEFESEEETEPL